MLCMNNNNNDFVNKDEILNRDKIIFNLKKSLDFVTRPVINTMGPNGMLVAITNGSHTQFTKDGVTVMRSIKGRTKFETTLANAIRSSCEKTNSIVGDGTTTTTCLLVGILNVAIKYLAAGGSAKLMIKGMEKAVDMINNCMLEFLIKPESYMLAQVATIAVDNDKKLGTIISNAIEQVDPKYGLINVEEGRGMSTELEISSGLKINAGYSSPHFSIKSKSGIIEFENTNILLINGEISSTNFIYQLLNDLGMSNKSCLLICDKIDHECLKLMLIGLLHNSVKITSVLNPYHGDRKLELLKDIALVTKAQIYDYDIKDDGVQFSNSVFGTCRSVKITQDSTILFHDIMQDKDIGLKVKEELSQIEKVLSERLESDDDYYVLKDRYTRLSGKAAIIRVGAPTGQEISEVKDRVYDAVCAVKAATSGVCLGGGVTLLRIGEILKSKIESLNLEKDIKAGFESVIYALADPIKQIINNSGKNAEIIIDKILNSNNNFIGYDALNDKIVNMLDSGIIDPFNVVNSLFRNAVSIAKMIICTSDIIFINNIENIDK